MIDCYTPIRAERGNVRTAKGWIQEAAKRMLMNNLDPEVAEKPEELIVYGGRGKAARNWECFHTIIATLDRLENNQTLLVQSGKAVAVLETQRLAPRVLIANSNLVPKWATWEEFDRLDAAGLMMYGQMTAGSWIYIGTQGILQGTYETFRGAAKLYFNDTLAGTITVTAGLGGMGGAQPLAVKLAGGVSICIEIHPARIQRRIETRYLDTATNSLDEAIRLAIAAKHNKQAISIGLQGNAAGLLPLMVKQGFTPDLVTDQTSAHDPKWGYIPIVRATENADNLRSQQPQFMRSAFRLPSRNMCRPSLNCSGAAPSHSTTATTCAPRQNSPALPTHFPIQGLSLHSFVTLSVRVAVHFGGSRSAEIHRTLQRLTKRCSISFQKTGACRSGSLLPQRKSHSKDFPRASAGLAIGSAIALDCSSMKWFATAVSRPQS